MHCCTTSKKPLSLFYEVKKFNQQILVFSGNLYLLPRNSDRKFVRFLYHHIACICRGVFRTQSNIKIVLFVKIVNNF